MADTRKLFERRKNRTRFQVRKLGGGRARLSVFRSNTNIYAQVIDDKAGRTLVAASTLDADLKSLGNRANVDAAKEVGRLVAERAKAAGVEEVVFDRGGYRYHGRVKALADAAREAGLKF